MGNTCNAQLQTELASERLAHEVTRAQLREVQAQILPAPHVALSLVVGLAASMLLTWKLAIWCTESQAHEQNQRAQAWQQLVQQERDKAEAAERCEQERHVALRQQVQEQRLARLVQLLQESSATPAKLAE